MKESNLIMTDEIIDFWKDSVFQLKGYGYYPIFRTYNGPYPNKWIIVKFDSFLDFHDFEYMDKHNKIIPTSELYKSIMFDIEAGNLTLYDTKYMAISSVVNGIIDDIYSKNRYKKDTKKEINELITIVMKSIYMR